MADSDKLLGVAYNNRSKDYTYSDYRIDYDSTESIVALGDEPEFTGATKNPPAGYSGHEAKTDYQRKVLVEDVTTRDEVTAILDDAGVTYVVEGVEPTDSEKAHIEDFGASNSLEGSDAMAWKRALEDLAAGNISQIDVECGRNPHRGENPGRPKNTPGREN